MSCVDDGRDPMGRMAPPNKWASGFCWGIVFTLAIFWLVGCQATLSPVDESRIRAQFERINDIAQIPKEIPELRYNADPSWPIAGEANCMNWSITLNYAFAASNPDFVIDKLIPHEFGHIVSCYYRGSTNGPDGNSHDTYWRKQVKRLGGDESYI